MISEINLYSADLPYFTFIFEKLNIFIDFYKLQYFKVLENSEIIIDTEDKEEIELFKKESEKYLPYICKFIFNDNTYITLYYNCEKYYIGYDTEHVAISHELSESDFTIVSANLHRCFLQFKNDAIKYTGKHTYTDLCEYKGVFPTDLFKNSIVKYMASVWSYSHVPDGHISDLE
jgi:hypothetical protein